MLRFLSVENFRSFDKPSQLDLRPITILLGRNSAGKSSLTRLFPLLQQSMERGTAAPILWNSTSIDFGKISDVINRNNTEAGMKITFGFSNESLRSASERRSIADSNIPSTLFSFSGSFTAHLGADKNGKTKFNSFELRVDSDSLVVFVRDGFARYVELNGERISKKGYWSNIMVGTRRLFPFLLFERDADRSFVNELPDTATELNEALSYFVNFPEPSTEGAPGRVRNILGGISYGARIPFIPRRHLAAVLSEVSGFINGSLEQKSKLKDLGDLILLTYFGQIIEQVGNSLSNVFTASTYLGPIRARGDRFYREQELSVDKIDDKGENLATYIGSLSGPELRTFNEMMIGAFGVEVRPHAEGGHISIGIGRPNDIHFDNLADVGFGFSQLLPLVAQLHSEDRRQSPWRPRNESEVRLTAVEQPELHLHPAYRANLADLFVSAVKNSKDRSNVPIIVLETHSESLLGRLGELISDKAIESDDVAIHFIEKDEATGSSSIRRGYYDADGFIENWPVGFFSARR